MNQAQAEATPGREVLGFQAEASQVLSLMIRSVYSNKEIFLRELISNASDACDKLRFLAIADDKLYETDRALRIRIEFNKDNKTITVVDNGIGMTRAEVIENIGTIAKSGTREFLNQLTGDQKKDAQLIGQFGVGFYSSFIVADKVTLRTRMAGTSKSDGVLWESDGKGAFSIEACEKEGRGTEVILHLHADEEEFLDDFTLKSIVKKFSDHIELPIVTTLDGKEEVVNAASALWTRPKNKITTKEYEEFYKTVSHDEGKPLKWLHAKMEGNLEYSLLFFIPEKAPFDLWTQEHQVGVKLYVKRIFIMDDAEKLLPKYLRFLRGIVDSADLPLNVSRELLQDNQLIHTIQRTAVKKVLELFADMATNDKETYQKFWREFGRVLKEGVVEDFAHKEEIAKLCRFASTFNDKEEPEVSLDDYIFRLKKPQDKIFYLIADNFAAAKGSVLLEAFRKKGLEVLLLSDRVDHWFVRHLQKYRDKEFQSVALGAVDLSPFDTDEEKKERQEGEKEHKEFLEKIRDVLKEQVLDVRPSQRLTDSPVCLLAHADDLDPNLKKVFVAVGQKIAPLKPILEINPHHALIKKLSQTKGEEFTDLCQLLFEEALLMSGEPLTDTVGFVKRVNRFLS